MSALNDIFRAQGINDFRAGVLRITNGQWSTRPEDRLTGNLTQDAQTVERLLSRAPTFRQAVGDYAAQVAHRAQTAMQPGLTTGMFDSPQDHSRTYELASTLAREYGGRIDGSAVPERVNPYDSFAGTRAEVLGRGPAHHRGPRSQPVYEQDYVM